MHSNRMRTARALPNGGGVLPDRDPSGQRPPDGDSLTETIPLDRDPPPETLLDTDPSGHRPPGHRPPPTPRQRPQTKTPLDRDPLDKDPPVDRDTPPPVDRQTPVKASPSPTSR